MKTAQRVISADSHTMEPADLWTSRVDRDLREIAPRVLKRTKASRAIAAESEIGWLPHWMQRMDHANMKFGAMMDTKLSMQPSDYVRRQIWLTFMDDAVGAASYEVIGRDSFM
jgi:hypothetical protein